MAVVAALNSTVIGPAAQFLAPKVGPLIVNGSNLSALNSTAQLLNGSQLVGGNASQLVGLITNGSQMLGLNGSQMLGLNSSHLLVANVSLALATKEAVPSALKLDGVTTPENSASSLLQLVLLLAILANSFLYVAPLSTAWRTLKEQVDFEAMVNSLAPAYFIFAQSYLWACYGFSTGIAGLAHFNILGALVCIIVLTMISGRLQSRDMIKPVLSTAIAGMLVFSVVLLVFPPSTRSYLLGFAATFFNLIMIIAPMPDVVEVLRQGDLGDYPLAFTVASFFSSFFWLQYALLVGDCLYLMPNLVGTVVCAAELYAIYWAVWGAGSIRSAQSLLESGGQPLMPRVRGKGETSSCGNFNNFLTEGSIGQICGNFGTLFSYVNTGRIPFASKSHRQMAESLQGKDAEFGLDSIKTKLWEKTAFGTFAGAPPSTRHASPEVSRTSAPTRSPFSAFDHPEGIEGFDGMDEPEDPQMAWYESVEPQADLQANAHADNADEFAYIDGETYHPHGGSAMQTQGEIHYQGRRGLDCIL